MSDHGLDMAKEASDLATTLMEVDWVGSGSRIHSLKKVSLFYRRAFEKVAELQKLRGQVEGEMETAVANLVRRKEVMRLVLKKGMHSHTAWEKVRKAEREAAGE